MSDLVRYVRFLRKISSLARQAPVSPDQARARIAARLAAREQGFLNCVERIVERPGGPFARLLAHAGVELGDVASLVAERGLEGALEQLYDAGVYATTAELKGDSPTRRGSLEFSVGHVDFDDPAVRGHFASRSGGSGGLPRTTVVNLSSSEYSSAHIRLVREQLGLKTPVMALWYPPPPGPGFGIALSHQGAGFALERWFAQTPWYQRGFGDSAAVTVGGFASSALSGRRVPFPRYTPPAEAARVARWVAGRRRAGREVYLAATPSSAVRVCRAAAELGLDLSGTVFRTAGEPLTPAKARLIADSGGRPLSYYYLSETSGLAGSPCIPGEAPDDIHLALDRIAVIARPRVLRDDTSVAAIHFSSITPGTRKLIINWESGDSGVVERRACGCELGKLGLHTHVHHLRSYEKLTSEGMTVPMESLIELIEEVLPARFGGAPNDYQLIEKESGELTRVRLRVNPQLGAIDDTEIVEAALAFLETRSGAERMMASVWRRTGTFEVERVPPHVTAASKTPALWRERH